MILLRHLCVLILVSSVISAKLNDDGSELTETSTNDTILFSELMKKGDEDLETNPRSRNKREPCGRSSCGCGGGGGKVYVVAKVYTKRVGGGGGGKRISYGKGYGKFKG